MKKGIAVILGFTLALTSGAVCRTPADSVDYLMNHLSIERKVAQMIVVTSDSRYGEQRKAEEDRAAGECQVGGLIIMGKELGPALLRADRLQTLAELPMLEFIDGEWGAAMRLTGFRPFPKQTKLSALPSDSLVYEMGRAVARELRSIKVNVNFAPVLDINVNPGNIVIGDRSFGSDREIVAKYGTAYARGLQDGGVIACAKHFPGHGDTSVDSHKGLPVLGFDLPRLEEMELYPFRYAIDRGLGMVMVGHLCAPALDPGGEPASISRIITTDYLKGKMNFGGLVVCDALNMKSIVDRCGSYALAALAAYKAGADILLMPGSIEKCIEVISDYIRRDPQRVGELDRRVRRILMTKAGFGMLSPGYVRTVNPEDVDPSVSSGFIDTLNDSIQQNIVKN